MQHSIHDISKEKFEMKFCFVFLSVGNLFLLTLKWPKTKSPPLHTYEKYSLHIPVYNFCMDFYSKYVSLTVLTNSRKYLKFCYNVLGILPKLYIYISASTKETTQLCQNVFDCLPDTRDLPTVKNRVKR